MRKPRLPAQTRIGGKQRRQVLSRLQRAQVQDHVLREPVAFAERRQALPVRHGTQRIVHSQVHNGDAFVRHLQDLHHVVPRAGRTGQHQSGSLRAQTRGLLQVTPVGRLEQLGIAIETEIMYGDHQRAAP